MQSLNFLHSIWLKLYLLEAEEVDYLVNFVLTGSATFLLASTFTLKFFRFGGKLGHVVELLD